MAESEKAKQIAARYMDFLTAEGFRPWIDADGDVVFKYEGRTYVIVIYEEDEEFFCLVYPNFWRIESDEERFRVQETALTVTAENKVVKIFPAGGTNTSATTELFLFPPDTFKPVFYRCLRAIGGAVKEFKAKMQEPPRPSDDFTLHLPRNGVETP